MNSVPVFEKKWASFDCEDHHYRVSTDGEVEKFEEAEWKPQRLVTNKKGYQTVSLAKDRPPCGVHRIVAKNFVENPRTNNTVGVVQNELANQVDHIDHNPLNNHASNLQWVTDAENQKLKDLRADHDKRQELITSEGVKLRIW